MKRVNGVFESFFNQRARDKRAQQKEQADFEHSRISLHAVLIANAAKMIQV